MFALMAAVAEVVAEVVDVIAKITRDFCVVQESVKGQVLLYRICSSLRSRPDAVFGLCLWNLRPASLSLGFHEIQALQEKLPNPEDLHFPLHLLEILVPGDFESVNPGT